MDSIKRPFRSFDGTKWIKHYFETSADQVKYAKKDGTESDVQEQITQILNDIAQKQNLLALGNNTVPNIDDLKEGITWYNTDRGTLGDLPFENFGFIAAFRSSGGNYFQVGIPFSGPQLKYRIFVNQHWYPWVSPVDDALLLAYPVGSIYMSVKNTNPRTLFGGTWVAWGSGKVPVGIDTSDTNFNTVEKTGGSKTVTLTTNQIPSHTHGLSNLYVAGEESGSVSAHTAGFTQRGARSITASTNATGGGQAHDNLQPYITCYMWKRTA